MYRALYRKWRPQRFEDVVAQRGIVTALRNQVASGRVGHAYLFTGVRGTGKTTCAKIFAKAVNCLHPKDGDPCGECEICKGIDNGSILDVVEMDAASNNGVDDIRDLRDETAYTPSACHYKVYIIDEVHMLSTAAFNALLKTLEEPPAHVIFILATTEIQKVPATILSRCQRYDFTRIGPEDIAQRVEYIAGQEGLELTTDGAELISRLADGAMRDALSILDTCAGVTAKIDADVVRRMAGVTDRSYLFRISDALEAQDGAAALAQLAALRQQSVDVKRLTEELIAHYRALMLAALPGGQSLLSGVSPEEEAQYLEKGPQLGQREAVRAIRTLGNALEHMTRGSDQRIELELALFTLSEPPQAAPAAAVSVQAAAPAAPVVRPFVSAPAQPAPQPFVSAPVAPPPAVQEPLPAPAAEPTSAPEEPAVSPASVPEEPAPAPAEEELPPPPDEPPVAESAPLPWDEPAAPVTAPLPEETPAEASAPTAPAPEYTADPAFSRPRKVAAEGINPFEQWSEVVKLLQEKDPMLHSYLRKSKAYFDGTRVLIDGGKTFRDFIRVNKDSQRLIKKLIAQVSGVAVPIGPYEPRTAAKHTSNAEQSLHALEKLGLEVSIEDSTKKKR
ncbi:DNA polymerase III subunit gamma/tau [Faecalibacterium sp. I3-3-89]|uniref:DNA polymerase III subunit gamma/tau n=1 Tax=Faecalibacterium sp. I3-3-89 TaxID=2929493 RepID=UPI002014C9E0|nr:DNA polymerase III subunit gamma/tau [Faecalibacterium sp. I3-3-89]UQK42209.1 DNA polymerase III subunit gamma/tau [Faecalibacterium sp. I3-3-89]